MTSNRKRSSGLALLRPELRLAVVFTISVLFIFINDLLLATVLFLLGLVLFLLNKEQNWKLALSVPFSGGMMFLYNAILSPSGYGGLHWFIFTINQVGIERGLVTGLRLAGVMFISFAWLFSTPIPEIYQGLAWLKPAEMWVLGILRGIQILKLEFIALTQSLIIRGLRWNSLLANIKNLVPLVTAIIPLIVKNAQEATFASQSHQRTESKGEGGIRVESLFVRYSSRLADVIEDISLKIEPGEFVYLAGKNAAGKSTLLRVLGGVISWIMGEFRGKVVISGMTTHETPLATLCGTVRFITPNPFASIHGLTVGQEISFLARDEESARKALGVMGIADLWDRETTKLSGGQQVRLVLSGALASEAKILLLDSPMQELDPSGRVAFMEALQILRQKKDCTVIVADPFWSELKDYADRVIVLAEGQLVADLAPQDFFLRERWLSECHLLPCWQKLSLPEPGEVVARLDDVHLTMEGNHILRGIDFSLRAGELVVIMGPNGAGKTTAMLTLAGAIAPTAGKVEREGSAGFVFQNPNLQIAGMTVLEELGFGPRILKWSEDQIEAFVQTGLEWTGLNPLACPLDLHPSEQRLLTIAASDVDTRIFILDEPTIGLDTKETSKVMRRVQEMLNRGIGVIIITHDENIAHLSHRVVIIDEGRVRYDGLPT